MTTADRPEHPLLATRSARVAAGLLATLTAAHLVAQLLDAGVVAETTQWFLMPALAATLWCTTATPRTRMVRLTLVALGFSWVGDTLPDGFTGDAAYLAMVGAFLCAQVVYVAAFWPSWRESVLALHPAAAAVYVFLAVTLLTLCLPGAPGVLAVAVVVYALCLTTMAVLATGVHRLAWLGGLLFLFSDAMIALGEFSDAVPSLSGFWIMATYVLGQVLLVAGVVARQTSARAVV